MPTDEELDALAEARPEFKTQIDHMKELVGDEPLLPELQEAQYEDEQFGTCIKHPLYVSIVHHPMHNRMANRAVTLKRESIERYEREGKYSTIISVLYERAWRLEALMKYADRMTDEQFWDAAGHVWVDSENIYEFRHEWEEILSEIDRPRRECMMNEKEREFLVSLPDEIEVHRGFWIEEAIDGFSYSLDKGTAIWFARRFARDWAVPQVVSGTVPKDKVIAFFNGRGEKEIVCLPDDIADRTITTHPGEQTRRPGADPHETLDLIEGAGE